MSQVRNLIIIGSGPAGLTAAIYASRAALSPILFTGIEIGGQLSETSIVENFPGFPEGVLGPELMQKMLQQAKNFGAEVMMASVDKVDFSSPTTKKVWAGNTLYESKSVIIASGASPKRLNIPGENKFWGKGVSTCATCDAPFFKEKEIAIVGGGDTAMEDGLFLSKFASKIYLIHRRDEFRASKIMQEKVRQNPKIQIIFDTIVEEIIGNEVVNSIRIKNVKNEKSDLVKVNGVFVAIGHKPNTDFLKGSLELDEHEYIKVFNDTKTSVDGVFAAGDVRDYIYRQAITAAGMGCQAALNAQKWLENN